MKTVSNIYSLKDFVVKKQVQKNFAQDRKPLKSFLNKNSFVFESFHDVNERLQRLEQACSEMTENYETTLRVQ